MRLSFCRLATLLIASLLVWNSVGVLAQPPEDELANEEPVQSEAPVQEGVVEHVTLYRDQALVTRRIELPAGEGVQEIRVGRLPEQVVSESVFAEGDGDTEVRVTRQASSVSDRQEVKVFPRVRPVQATGHHGCTNPASV